MCLGASSPSAHTFSSSALVSLVSVLVQLFLDGVVSGWPLGSTVAFGSVRFGACSGIGSRTGLLVAFDDAASSMRPSW